MSFKFYKKTSKLLEAKNSFSSPLMSPAKLPFPQFIHWSQKSSFWCVVSPPSPSSPPPSCVYIPASPVPVIWLSELSLLSSSVSLSFSLWSFLHQNLFSSSFLHTSLPLLSALYFLSTYPGVFFLYFLSSLPPPCHHHHTHSLSQGSFPSPCGGETSCSLLCEEELVAKLPPDKKVSSPCGNSPVISLLYISRASCFELCSAWLEIDPVST